MNGAIMNGYVALSYLDLAIAALLVLLNGALSIVFRLGLERTLLLATVRMVVQLGAVGFVLKFIFAQTSPLWTLALALVMVAIAGREVWARQTTPFRGWWAYGLGTATLLFVGTLATGFAVGLLIAPEPWYGPRFILPILGMMLGNTLTGVSLALETLTTIARRERAAIEARIALGSPRMEALSGAMRQAMKTGTLPIINAMAAAGIVSLPGMMTGQILAGIDPVEATKYQLLIMFLLAGATALAVLLATLAGVHLLTDERHRLRLDRLHLRSDL